MTVWIDSKNTTKREGKKNLPAFGSLDKVLTVRIDCKDTTWRKEKKNLPAFGSVDKTFDCKNTI